MKKTKLYISFFLIFSVIAFCFITGSRLFESEKPGLMPQGTPSERFIIGAMQSCEGPDPGYYGNLDQLHINLWHKYLGPDTYNGRNVPLGWTEDDQLMRPLEEYQVGVTNILGETYSYSQMKTLMQRPKIEWLCRGQRSDYRCVDTSKLENKELWFYTFQSHDHIGHDVPDDEYLGGKYVRFCRTQNSTNQGNWFDDPGMVVSRLRSNTEQCNRVFSGSGNEWFGDSQSDWYIKPRIRIDSTVAHSIQNPIVCEIKIIAQDDVTVLLDVDIHARDFLVDGGLYYNGRYIEEYNFSGPTELTILNRDWLGTDTKGKWLYEARGEHYPDSAWDNHTDIQVYWYGNCDMWIDYVRVDNNVAHRLLSGNDQEFDLWLQWEANNIACNHDSPWKFYQEIPEFNNIPCITYVSHKLDSLCDKHITMVTDIQNNYSVHVSWEDRSRVQNATHIRNNLVEKVGITHLIMESYPFTGTYSDPPSPNPDITYSRIPNTLPNHDPYSGKVLAF